MKGGGWIRYWSVAELRLADSIRHTFTNAYRFQTIGKVERCNRTLLIRWPRQALPVKALETSALDAWLHIHNHCPHCGQSDKGKASSNDHPEERTLRLRPSAEVEANRTEVHLGLIAERVGPGLDGPPWMGPNQIATVGAHLGDHTQPPAPPGSTRI